MTSTSSLQICIVSTDFVPASGGVANHVAQLGLALSELGHEVTVVTSNRERSDLDQRREMRIVRIRTGYRGSRYMFAAVSAMRNRTSDIVHWHVAHEHLDNRAARWVRAEGKVFTNHTSEFVRIGSREGAKSAKYSDALEFAGRVIVPSRELAQLTSKYLSSADKVRYVPNGVDVRRFQTPSRARVDNRTRPVVVAVRRLVHKNGVDVLIGAWASVAAVHPDARLLIAGDGSERRALEAATQKLGIGQSVTFLGSLPNGRVPALLASADVFVIPSRIEATSLACLEAMAAGLPVVATNVGGLPELVLDSKTGFLVPPENPVEMATAISRLLENPSVSRRFGESGRRRAISQYSWASVAQKTEIVYQETLSSTRKGHG